MNQTFPVPRGRSKLLPDKVVSSLPYILLLGFLSRYINHDRSHMPAQGRLAPSSLCKHLASIAESIAYLEEQASIFEQKEFICFLLNLHVSVYTNPRPIFLSGIGASWMVDFTHPSTTTFCLWTAFAGVEFGIPGLLSNLISADFLLLLDTHGGRLMPAPSSRRALRYAALEGGTTTTGFIRDLYSQKTEPGKESTGPVFPFIHYKTNPSFWGCTHLYFPQQTVLSLHFLALCEFKAFQTSLSQD